MGIVRIAGKTLRVLSFGLSLAALVSSAGCHAQPAAKPGVEGALSPALARRVEVLIRARSDVPPEYAIHVGPRTHSEVPGYDTITVDFAAEGKTVQPATFLLSTDGKTLAQFKKFDISRDPKETVSGANRPARGGPADAPVLVVGFDDLECPFCSRMNAQLFPALLARYGDQVRVVYRDFPLDQHPWAMRAAIDTNCVGAQSGTGYWNLVDFIHSHADEVGGGERSVEKANQMLDMMTRDEAKRQKIDEAKVDACIAKQDTAAVKQSMKEAEALGVDSTPALFINGEKIEGAQPIEYVYRMIDGALVAAGKTPPPTPAKAPVAAPAAATGAGAVAAPVAARPGE